MSLLSTFTDANKVTNSLLSIRYTTEYDPSGYYRMIRTATKSYSYIGMTQAAAVSCKTAKVAQYTRELCREDGINYISSGNFIRPGVILQKVSAANVTVTHEENNSWSCNIEVNESDYLTSFTPPSDCEQPFYQYTSSRNYDESISRVAITNITHEIVDDTDYCKLTMSYGGMSNVIMEDIWAEYKSSASESSWYPLPPDNNLSTVNNLYISGLYESGTIFRVTVKGIASAVKTYSGS